MKKIVTVAALAALAGTAFGQAFSEDFSGGIPASWTVVDNAGNGVVWDTSTNWGDGNYTNGSGDAAAVNSDTFGPADYDVSLFTHTFTVPAGAHLTLSANYQNFANLDFFDINFNGDNLLSWNEDHGGFFAAPGEDIDIDLSAYAGQSGSVEFHYYDPSGTSDWDWYVQIDDVAVTGVPAPGAMALLGLSGLVATRRRR